MIEYSKKRRGRARDENVDPKQMAVAELMAWGWDAQDAMLAVGLIRESDDKAEAAHAALSFSSNADFDKLRKKRVKQLRGGCVLDEYQKLHPTPGGISDGRGAKRADGGSSFLQRKLWQGDTEPVADDEILAAMWETITQLQPSDPKRVDLLDKYDKLKRRQGAGNDDNTIHFYLPRPECDTCPFRGDHVITEPEETAGAAREEGEEEDEDEDEDEKKNYYVQRPGYTKNGKRIGRPPKHRRKARPKPTDDDSPIDIFQV